MEAEKWAAARTACQEDYRRTGDEEDLADLGYAYWVLGELDQATDVARRLLDGPLRGKGHLLLCEALTAQDRGRLAHDHGIDAYMAHLVVHKRSNMTADALCMSQSAWQFGDFESALSAAEDTIRLAAATGQRSTEFLGHIARIDALRRIGAWREASEAVDAAVVRVTSECDQAWLHLKGGMLLEESDQASLAPIEYDLADRANATCRSTEITSAVDLNRAMLLVRDHPDQAGKILDAEVAAYGDAFEIRLMRAVIAGNRGDRVAAAELLADAAGEEPPDEDWRWELERTRAELAAAAGDPAGDLAAERAYRRAMVMVSHLRATTQRRSALLLASHHAPYDGLILLLARQGRWQEALAVVEELDASDMLQAAADLGQVGAVRLSMEGLVDAWRGRELVIVVAPSRRLIAREPEPVIRIHVVDGRVTGELFGSAEETRAAAGTLFGNPDQVEAARALGRVLVPADQGTGTLDILALGSLGKVPLAALRDATGSLIIARRPLGHVLSLRPRAAEAPSDDRAIVLADPRGDLLSARFEGRLVAGLLGERAALAGADATPATSERLGDARHAGLLHVAAHVADHGRWRVLRLADRDVDPAEFVRLGIAPRLAVLASCGSGAAHDDEGWGSIAAALIASGTTAVVATDRAVGDFSAFRLVMSFYAQPDWAADPTRALARVQVGQARLGIAAAEWAAFGVLRGPPSLPR